MTRMFQGNGRPTGLALPVLVLLAALLICPAVTSAAKAGKKEKREGLNTQFRTIAEEMKALYQDGKLEEIISSYKKNCLRRDKDKLKKQFKKVNKEVRAEIYRLVFLTYTALDKPEAADSILAKFLAIRHHEGVDDSAWVYIREIAEKKFHVAPRFTVGFKAGINYTMVQPGDRYMVLEPVNPAERESYHKNYRLHLNHSRSSQYGLILEYGLTKNISITIQPTLDTVRFQYKNVFTREQEDDEPTTLNFTHRQQLNYVDVPVLLTYRLLAGKFKPYFQVGGYYSILTAAEKLIHGVSLPGEEYEEEVIIGIKDQLNTSNFGVWISAGLEYELGRSGIRLQLATSYRHGLNNMVNEDRRFENKQLMYAFYDVFDDMKLRNWDLSINILLPLSYKAFKK